MPPPTYQRAEISMFAPVERAQAAEAPPDLLRLLYRQVRSLAGPRPDLDDLVQAAAERALKALPRFEGRSALSTWTYGIAYRTLLDHDRWFRRWRKRFSFSEDMRVPEPETERDSETAALELARARRLHDALERLPAAKRAVLVLHDLEGVEMREIASIVIANERTVRSRLRDGRKKLLELLRADPLFDSEGRP